MNKLITFLFVLLLGHSAHSFAGSQSLDDFSLTSLDGTTVDLADYRGKVVMVNFWASWCPPCVHELPSMQTLYENLEGQPFEVLALNMTEEPDQVKSFLENFDTTLTFPVLLRADKSVADAWKVRGLPTTVILAKDGTRAMTWQGPREWDSDEVRDLLQPLLDE